MPKKRKKQKHIDDHIKVKIGVIAVCLLILLLAFNFISSTGKAISQIPNEDGVKELLNKGTILRGSSKTNCNIECTKESLTCLVAHKEDQLVGCSTKIKGFYSCLCGAANRVVGEVPEVIVNERLVEGAQEVQFEWDFDGVQFDMKRMVNGDLFEIVLQATFERVENGRNIHVEARPDNGEDLVCDFIIGDDAEGSQRCSGGLMTENANVRIVFQSGESILAQFDTTVAQIPLSEETRSRDNSFAFEVCRRVSENSVVWEIGGEYRNAPGDIYMKWSDETGLEEIQEIAVGDDQQFATQSPAFALDHEIIIEWGVVGQEKEGDITTQANTDDVRLCNIA